MFALTLSRYITSFVKNGEEIILRTNYNDEESDRKCYHILYRFLSDKSDRILTYKDLDSPEYLTVSIETKKPEPLLNVLKFNGISETALFKKDNNTGNVDNVSDTDSLPNLEEENNSEEELLRPTWLRSSGQSRGVPVPFSQIAMTMFPQPHDTNMSNEDATACLKAMIGIDGSHP